MAAQERPHTHLAINLFGEQLPISPPMYDTKLGINPGDLTQYAQTGTGMYGYKEQGFDPKEAIHIHEDEGGLIFFDDNVKKENLEGALKAMGVGDNAKYLSFAAVSKRPVQDRYISQLRIVQEFGLRYHFGVDEKLNVPEQKLTVPEAVWAFMEQQKKAFGENPSNHDTDGYWTIPALAFGFMVENSYFGIYRVWSRVWHVTR